MQSLEPTADAPQPELRSYRIFVATWDLHKIYLEAESADAAQHQAEKLWNDDPDSFKWVDSGVDEISAEEMAS